SGEEPQELFGIVVAAEGAQARARAAGQDERGALHEAARSSVAVVATAAGLRPTAMRLSPEPGRSPSSARNRGTRRSKMRDCASGSAERRKTRELSHQASFAARF